MEDFPSVPNFWVEVAFGRKNCNSASGAVDWKCWEESQGDWQLGLQLRHFHGPQIASQAVELHRAGLVVKKYAPMATSKHTGGSSFSTPKCDTLKLGFHHSAKVKRIDNLNRTKPAPTVQYQKRTRPQQLRGAVPDDEGEDGMGYPRFKLQKRLKALLHGVFWRMSLVICSSQKQHVYNYMFGGT